jgi:hypothetical protein
LADLRVAGFGGTGHGSMLAMMMPKAQLPAIDGPEQAQAWVDTRVGEGSDFTN